MYDPYNPYESEAPKIEVNFKRNRISTKKSGIGTVNAGGAIIIIIFVVLCLTIFGLLSFTTSFADKKLADRNLESVSQYYRADAIAEEALAKIYDSVYTKILLTSGPENFFGEDLVQSAIDGISDIFGETVEFMYVYDTYIGDDEAVTVAYKTDMGSGASKDQLVRFYLNSEVNLFYDQNAQKLTYKISEWKVIINSEFDYENEQIDVWNGQINF